MLDEQVVPACYTMQLCSPRVLGTSALRLPMLPSTSTVENIKPSFPELHLPLCDLSKGCI